MRLGYAAIMIAAILAGGLLVRRTQQQLALSGAQKFGIGLGAFIGAIVGAKLPFLFEDWERFLDGSAWFADGKTILTGLVGGYLGVEIAKWTMGLSLKTGDTFVLPVAVIIAIGRLGCFFAGCCYGKPTNLPWGTVFASADTQPRHPNQLYEFIFHLASTFSGEAGCSTSTSSYTSWCMQRSDSSPSSFDQNR